MKIVRQFQDLHCKEPSADWVLKQCLERDICLLYHQLAEYSYIMGDLYYDNVFGLPYWDHLEMPGLDPVDRDFVRDGCLVMILAMASECLDGSGAYLVPHIESCIANVGALNPSDPETRKLVETVLLALELAKRSASETQELSRACVWVHEHYVRRYFTQRADEFRSNPYFLDDSTTEGCR